MPEARHAVHTPRNVLLAALSAEDLAYLEPQLQPIELRLRDPLMTTGRAIEHALFPETGWASNLVALSNGDAVEVGLIGRDGIVGLPLLFGESHSPTDAIVQASGSALRLRADAFQRAITVCDSLRGILLRYAHAFHIQVAHAAACNSRHRLEQRLARWLLMAHDRADGDSYPITHEFLSLMLGVRRAGITNAVGTLQRARLIHYGRAHVQIIDRRGLEAVTCECYAAARREADRLMRMPRAA